MDAENVLDLGDVIRHEKHGVGIVAGRVGESFSTKFLRGRARINPKRATLICRRRAFVRALRTNDPDPDVLTAALIALRISDAEVAMAAATFFAVAKTSDVTGRLKTYLELLAPRIRESVDLRLAIARDDSDAAPILRGVARQPGESIDGRIRRLNDQLRDLGRPGLTPGQVRRMREPYHSRCHECHASVDADRSLPCPKCLWFVCVCGACAAADYRRCQGKSA